MAHPPTVTAPIVTTQAGQVRGFWRGESAAFLGIPFAEPPVGELRFGAPVPHQAWAGVRDATAYGATAQRGDGHEPTTIPEPSIPGDSTLNVNVFTPSPGMETAGLPVLVYIHGGGFQAGSPASPWHDGKAFNRDGVVTVTISYRFGFDGFGWIADAPHNRGVLDWVLALEWVRDNICGFGGDPDQVTIAGQSAGGAAVLTLLGMPRAQSLFARVIALSAPGRGVATLTNAERNGRLIAESAGVEHTRAGLSQLDELTVLEVQKRVSQPAADDSPIAGLRHMMTGEGLRWLPVADGDLISHPVLDLIAAGVGADKPLMLGATDQEFNREVIEAAPGLAAFDGVEMLTAVGLTPGQAAAFVASHPGLNTAQLVGQCASDLIFRAFNREVAEARVIAAEARTWLYRFAWRSPKTGYASHCYDLPFFFDLLDSERIETSFGDSPPQSVADDLHSAAVSFIHGDDPGWPAYDEARDVRVFDVPSSVIPDGYADVTPLDVKN